jgi:hypothetical protein
MPIRGEHPSAETSALLKFLSRPVGMVFVGVRETPLRIAAMNFFSRCGNAFRL